MRKLFWSVPVTLLLFIGISVALVFSNLHTYNRLTDEEPVAKLRFSQVDAHQYQVELRTGDFCEVQQFILYGDQWRLDARFLKWKSWANLFGLDAMYQLERITGRYRDIVNENARKHQVYAVAHASGLVLAEYANKTWMPVDTLFGSSVYETIEVDYEYRVYRSQSGLLARKHVIPLVHYDSGSLVIPIQKDCQKGGS